MDIVDACPNDLTVQDAARIAGRSVKTVRRAVHAGQLPMRYVLGLRGPQLVFKPEEIERWQSDRGGVVTARARHGRRRRHARKQSEPGPKVAALTALVEEQRSMIVDLSKQVSNQYLQLEKVSDLLAELTVQVKMLARQRQPV